tara:strand:+ start:421 stop:801 length:381 start_codon:yes stop_codon:yes gene_type:complete
MKRGAIVVILNSNLEVLLLKRPDFVRWAPEQWAFPGGKIEKGESSRDAAVRETREETTLEARDLVYISELSHGTVDYFFSNTFTGEVQIDFEHDDWVWVSREETKYYDTAPQVVELYDWALNYVRR